MCTKMAAFDVDVPRMQRPAPAPTQHKQKRYPAPTLPQPVEHVPCGDWRLVLVKKVYFFIILLESNRFKFN